MNCDLLFEKCFEVMKELARVLPRLTRIEAPEFEKAIWKIFPETRQDPKLFVQIHRQIVYIYDLKPREDPPKIQLKVTCKREERDMMKEKFQVPPEKLAKIAKDIAIVRFQPLFKQTWIEKPAAWSRTTNRDCCLSWAYLRNRMVQKFIISDLKVLGKWRDDDAASIFSQSFVRLTRSLDMEEFDKEYALPIFIKHNFNEYFEMNEWVMMLPEFDIGQKVFAEAKEFRRLGVTNEVCYCLSVQYKYSGRNLVNPVSLSVPKGPLSPTSTILAELYGEEYLEKIEEAFDDTDSEADRVDLNTIPVPWYNPRFEYSPEEWELLLQRITGLKADDRGNVLPGLPLRDDPKPPVIKWYHLLFKKCWK